MVIKRYEMQRFMAAGIVFAGITPNILSAIILQNPFYSHIGLLFTALTLPAFILSFYNKGEEKIKNVTARST